MGKALIPGTDNRAFLTVIRSLGRKNICMHVGMVQRELVLHLYMDLDVRAVRVSAFGEEERS